MRLNFCVMLAVCLWVVPAVQAAPSNGSTGTSAAYETKSVEAPVVSGPSETGEATLVPDVERTAMIRRGRVPRMFYYLGQKGERISIEVSSVNFYPEVFVKDPEGAVVDLSGRPEDEAEAASSLKTSMVAGATGRYTIGVRSKNSNGGLFHIILRTGSVADAKSSD